MLETSPRPQFRIQVPPRLLQEGYLVHFGGDWPSTFGHIREKTFRINAVNTFKHDLAYIIPEDDYRDVDFSNGSGDYQESIYPEKYETLQEVALGFKVGNYLVHWLIPADRYIHQYEFAGMYPDITDANKKYIGATNPEDSPYTDPRVKFYLIKDLAPLIMRLYVNDGIDYEKIVVGLWVNKCKLEEVPAPSSDELLKAKVIRYYDYLKW